MTEGRRSDFRPLVDLHEDALRETDAEAVDAAERYMAWFDRHVAPEAPPADGRGDGRPRTAHSVEAMASPENARSLPARARALVPLVIPVALAAAAVLAVWLVPPARDRAPAPPSPRILPPATAPILDDPCRSAIRARGDSPLIDNFEDGNELVALREARNGYWVALSDTDPDGAEPILVPSLRLDPSPGNRYALHVNGGRLRTWGASVQVEFGPSCYDASAYSGIAFEARGPGRLYAGIRGVDAVPVARGGTCTEGCYQSHLGLVTLESGWKTYVLSWRELRQDGATTPLDLRRANGIEFLVRPDDTPYDLWIDDVRFVHDSTDGGSP
jgi:hypothetical protein